MVGHEFLLRTVCFVVASILKDHIVVICLVQGSVSLLLVVVALAFFGSGDDAFAFFFGGVAAFGGGRRSDGGLPVVSLASFRWCLLPLPS